MKVKFALVIAGVMTPSVVVAQTDEIGPSAEWQIEAVENGCRLTKSDQQAASKFAYSKYRDGRFELQLGGKNLRTASRPDASLRLHFGEETVDVESSFDPIMPYAAKPFGEDDTIRLFDDLDYFEASVGEGPRERFTLDGIENARARFLRCLKELPAGQGPPRLIEFTGIHKLTAVASRQRMLGETLRFTLQVAADGRAVDCTLSRKFRRKFVTISFCRVLMEHHLFAPARDAAGVPVAGSYVGTVRLDMPIKAG